MKKIIIISLLIIVAILVVIIAVKKPAEKNIDLSATELYNLISKEIKLPEMIERDSSDLEMRYGISTTNVSSYKYMSNGTSYYVDTIAIFKSSDSTVRESIKSSLQTVLTSTRNSMKDYDAKQYSIAEKGEVISKGEFVILVMSSDILSVKSVINKNV